MPTVLIVDDEKNFLASLQDGLREHADNFQALWATDGSEAKRILDTRRVDLLVTDLKMPGLSGFELLAHCTRYKPEMPVIVMTAFGTPEIEMRLGRLPSLHYLEKPLDLDVLVRSIYSSLKAGSQSLIRGITLPTFLQLLHMEKKTCTLKIRSHGRTGYLYIRQGMLQAAETGTLTGEGAALEIATWEEAEIEMDAICRKMGEGLQASLEYILMEAFRLKDEGQENAVPANAQEASPSCRPMAIKALPKIPGIGEAVVFDERGFLEFKSGEGGILPRLDPAIFLDVGETIGDQMGWGPVCFLQFSLPQGRRLVLFARPGHRFALTLQPRARPADVLKALDRAIGP